MAFGVVFWLTLSFPAWGIHQGTLRIDEDGVPLDLHLVALSEKGQIFSTSGKSLTMKWGDQVRGFLAKHETDEMPMSNYYNFTLLDKEFSYDVNLSAVGCSCSAALFFVSMPGYNPNGTVARGDGSPYYCDANEVGGVWCWEHDTIEGNKYTMATTPHVCTAKPGRYIDSCDRGGSGVNAFEMNPKGMCPDDDCEIDTRRPFRIHQRFEANWKGKLIRIVNRLTQEGRVFTWDACTDTTYLEQMTMAFSNKMTMVFQLWGDRADRMSWLDKVTGCSGACVAEATEVTFSNIAIRSLAPPGASIVV